MADRMQSYQMNAQNMMPNFIPQQQMQQQPQQQQQQQQQQQDSQMVSGLPNSEQHGRMWTPLQNNYRGQPGVDVNPSQMNQQMADLARNQVLSHAHSSQGPLVQQIQQQFGLSSQRVPTANPSFHDPQSSNPQPSNIPPNFASIPMNTPQLKAGNTMQGLGNRPMHLMDRVSNQQNQHQPQTAIALARMQQMSAQPGSSQPTSSDMFSASNMPNVDPMHSSPHLGSQSLGPQMGHPNMMPGRAATNPKMPTLPELMQRREYLQTAINTTEQSIQRVLTQTGGFPNETWTEKLEKMHAELKSRKALFVRVNQAIQQLTPNNVFGGNLAHLNTMANATGRPGVMQGGGASQQPWPSSSNPPSNFGMSAVASGPPQIPPAGQNHPMNTQLSGQGGQISQRPGGVPPRSGPTPQQPPTNVSNMVSHNMGPQFNFPSVSNGQMPNRMVNLTTIGVTALERSHFEMMYTSYCKNHLKEPNLHVMLPDNRTVDLHNLHVQVFREGGAQLVSQRDLWAVIGGRMGLVQFPGMGTDPPKSGPGIAQQLAHVYKEHLQGFETAYVMTMRSRPTQRNPLPQNGNPGSTTGAAGEIPHGGLRIPLHPQAIAQVARFVNMSVNDMRANGLPEQMIVAVERYRPEILRWQQHRMMLAKTNQQTVNSEVPGEQPGMPNVPQGTFPNQVSAAGPSMVPTPHGQPPIMSNGMQPRINEMKPAIQSGPIPQPTQEQLANAMTVIQNTKRHFIDRRLPMMPSLPLPDDQRMEYGQLLEQVSKLTRDIEAKLPMFYIILRSDDIIRRLIAIVLMVTHQRHLCANGSPQYIINLPTLKSMVTQVQKMNEEFEQRVQMLKAATAGSQQMGGLTGPHINRPSQLATSNIPSTQATPPQTLQPPQTGPPISRHPSANQSQPSPHTPAGMSQLSSHPPPPPPQVKKPPIRVPPSPSVAAATATTSKVPSPTPPPANPTATAPTPVTAASPQPPKSPNKQPPKAKTGHRTPKPLPASPSAPSPAFAPGVKRPADEDASILPSVGPSQPEPVGAPSPKKVKTEDWDEEPGEAFVGRHQEVDGIKTEEDTAAFLDRMKELVAISASTDTAVYDDITHTLEMILQGAGQDPTDITTTAFASSIGPPLSELSPPAGPPNDPFSEFHEFFDFSRFTTLEDEEESKAPTPDLVPSSTNPSPQSNPDADQSHQGTSSPDKTKVEEPRDNHHDLLHMGAFKEIDGGESAYYQSSDWKWEGPMSTLEPAWAIYQTS